MSPRREKQKVCT